MSDWSCPRGTSARCGRPISWVRSTAGWSRCALSPLGGPFWPGSPFGWSRSSGLLRRGLGELGRPGHVRRLREDVERALAPSETDREAFRRDGGLPADAEREIRAEHRKNGRLGSGLAPCHFAGTLKTSSPAPSTRRPCPSSRSGEVGRLVPRPQLRPARSARAGHHGLAAHCRMRRCAQRAALDLAESLLSRAGGGGWPTDRSPTALWAEAHRLSRRPGVPRAGRPWRGAGHHSPSEGPVFTASPGGWPRSVPLWTSCVNAGRDSSHFLSC